MKITRPERDTQFPFNVELDDYKIFDEKFLLERKSSFSTNDD